MLLYFCWMYTHIHHNNFKMWQYVNAEFFLLLNSPQAVKFHIHF